MSSKYDLEDFAIRPSAQQLEKCRKDDLFGVADLYQIRVYQSVVKREVKEVVLKYMVENGILPEEGELAGVANPISSSGGEGAEQTKPQELISIDPAALPSPQDPLLNIKLKELELKLSRQQYQSQLLQFKTVELETQRTIRLKELELEIKTKVPNKPPNTGPHEASTPKSPPPFNTSTPGHLIAVCPVLKRKANRRVNTSKSVALVDSCVPDLSSTVGSAFEPFTSDGMVSFDEAMSEAKPVCILRDTGSAQSFILVYLGADVQVKGIDLTVI